MLKKLFFPLLAAFILAGCASNSNTLDVAPKIQLPQRDPSLMGITVSINGADQRSDQALAKVNRDGQLITLTPSRDLRFLLQETLEKQMTARGYMIGPNGAVDLQIVVNGLYADVHRGQRALQHHDQSGYLDHCHREKRQQTGQELPSD